ncbi:expressed unknown protein [Seminavis robusta]|uniref:Nuclease associated modular domain-containing protein n=1 Tax=Seminavis robusta TaxID=568900 RepID=A0A9N8H0J3_9STRA|nr:expressed unknown protein [Seminavis robusta]|eukprot:Sro21_g014890.1 n/a (478) ;mRNA; r:129363-130796
MSDDEEDGWVPEGEEEEEGDEEEGGVSNKPQQSSKRPQHGLTADTAARMTENGGYAHTLDSKLKISKANRGNTPWNKGKVRSAADKAKIGAGVRARNRAILLEKLSRIGMSEEEWFAKKKQLKYLRERVRRAKKAKDDKALKEHQESLNSVLAVQERVNSQPSAVEQEQRTRPKKTPKEPPKKKRKETVVPHKAKINMVTTSTTTSKKDDTDNNNNNNNDSQATAQSSNQATNNTPIVVIPKTATVPPTMKNPQQLAEIFARDIEWNEHPYDTSDLEAPYDACPKGGPGGLICCAHCTRQYSQYLNATSKDMEEQRTHKVISEVKELLGFLQTAQTQLGQAVQTARQPIHKVAQGLFLSSTTTTSTKPPPLKPPPKPKSKSKTKRNQKQPNKKQKSDKQNNSDPVELPDLVIVDDGVKKPSAEDFTTFPPMMDFLQNTTPTGTVGTTTPPFLKLTQPPPALPIPLEEEHDAIEMVEV